MRSFQCSYLFGMWQINCPSAALERKVVMLATWHLCDDKVPLHIIQRHLAIYVRHGPVHPGPSHFIDEVVDHTIVCPSANSVACFEEKC